MAHHPLEAEASVRLDPDFALAYAALATCYYDLGEPSQAAQYAKRAYDLRDRVSEREKLSIESGYHLFATGDLEKARQAWNCGRKPIHVSWWRGMT